MLSLSDVVKILNKSVVPISFLLRKLGWTLFSPLDIMTKKVRPSCTKEIPRATIFVEWTCEEEFIQERRRLFEKRFEFKIYCLKKWFLTIKLKNPHQAFKKKKEKKRNKLHNGTRLRRRGFSREYWPQSHWSSSQEKGTNSLEHGVLWWISPLETSSPIEGMLVSRGEIHQRTHAVTCSVTASGQNEPRAISVPWGWMMGGQETLFHWVLTPLLTMVVTPVGWFYCVPTTKSLALTYILTITIHLLT
jgi:hypothetical protein